jgi:hypothetical protein
VVFLETTSTADLDFDYSVLERWADSSEAYIKTPPPSPEFEIESTDPFPATQYENQIFPGREPYLNLEESDTVIESRSPYPDLLEEAVRAQVVDSDSDSDQQMKRTVPTTTSPRASHALQVDDDTCSSSARRRLRLRRTAVLLYLVRLNRRTLCLDDLLQHDQQQYNEDDEGSELKQRQQVCVQQYQQQQYDENDDGIDGGVSMAALDVFDDKVCLDHFDGDMTNHAHGARIVGNNIHGNAPHVILGNQNLQPDNDDEDGDNCSLDHGMQHDDDNKSSTGSLSTIGEDEVYGYDSDIDKDRDMEGYVVLPVLDTDDIDDSKVLPSGLPVEILDDIRAVSSGSLDYFGRRDQGAQCDLMSYEIMELEQRAVTMMEQVQQQSETLLQRQQKSFEELFENITLAMSNRENAFQVEIKHLRDQVAAANNCNEVSPIVCGLMDVIQTGMNSWDEDVVSEGFSNITARGDLCPMVFTARCIEWAHSMKRVHRQADLVDARSDELRDDLALAFCLKGASIDLQCDEVGLNYSSKADPQISGHAWKDERCTNCSSTWLFQDLQEAAKISVFFRKSWVGGIEVKCLCDFVNDPLDLIAGEALFCEHCETAAYDSVSISIAGVAPRAPIPRDYWQLLIQMGPPMIPTF